VQLQNLENGSALWFTHFTAAMVLSKRVRKITKSDYELRHVRPSVRLSAWNSAPTELTSMKLDI